MRSARHNSPMQIQRRSRGFTLIEMMIATVVLLVGLVGVAQLVPVSVLLNTANRNDSTSLVIAQREMDQLMAQPLASLTFTDPTGLTCAIGDICNLGDPNLSNPNLTPPLPPPLIVGSPVVNSGTGPLINFAAPLQPGYSFSTPWVDPNDGTNYDIRWAVVTSVNASVGPQASGKRFIVGVRRQGGNTFFPPINLDCYKALEVK